MMTYLINGEKIAAKNLKQAKMAYNQIKAAKDRKTRIEKDAYLHRTQVWGRKD